MVNEKYWRANKTSERVHLCFEQKACLGGFVEEGNEAVECLIGYTGILCSVCNKTEDEEGRRFMRSGKTGCSYCPKFLYNTIRIIGF